MISVNDLILSSNIILIQKRKKERKKKGLFKITNYWKTPHMQIKVNKLKMLILYRGQKD